nr:MAG TPA: hypothetical protein [Caudoviricetes sp.]
MDLCNWIVDAISDCDLKTLITHSPYVVEVFRLLCGVLFISRTFDTFIFNFTFFIISFLNGHISNPLKIKGFLLILPILIHFIYEQSKQKPLYINDSIFNFYLF